MNFLGKFKQHLALLAGGGVTFHENANANIYPLAHSEEIVLVFCSSAAIGGKADKDFPTH